MQILKKPIAFDCDSGNQNKNLKKHDITDQESEEVFTNEPLLLKPDEVHSQTEARYHALGHTNSLKGLFISFTIRNNKIRIISSRPMNKKEKFIYEKA